MKKIKDFFNSDKGFTFLSVFVILKKQLNIILHGVNNYECE